MNPKSKEPLPKNRSLLFAIEDLSKLLRNEVKKTASQLKKSTTSQITSASSPDFVRTVEQIAKLLRSQAHKMHPKKKRAWGLAKKTSKSV